MIGKPGSLATSFHTQGKNQIEIIMGVSQTNLFVASEKSHTISYLNRSLLRCIFKKPAVILT